MYANKDGYRIGECNERYDGCGSTSNVFKTL